MFCPVYLCSFSTVVFLSELLKNLVYFLFFYYTILVQYFFCCVIITVVISEPPRGGTGFRLTDRVPSSVVISGIRLAGFLCLIS